MFQPFVYFITAVLVVFDLSLDHQKDTRSGTQTNVSAFCLFHYCCPCSLVSPPEGHFLCPSGGLKSSLDLSPPTRRTQEVELKQMFQPFAYFITAVIVVLT